VTAVQGLRVTEPSQWEQQYSEFNERQLRLAAAAEERHVLVSK